MGAPRNNVRDQMMHSSSGTTPLEIMLVIVSSLFYNIIGTAALASSQDDVKNSKFNFIVEFLIIVIPILLNTTVLADYAFQVFSGFFVISCSFIWYISHQKHLPKKSVSQRDCITNTRSTVNVISVIAILAVDFLVFPRRFAKTETFGYSLMDVGVGLFVFSNAIVDGGQTDLVKAVKGSIPLIILGVGRFFVTTQADYYVPVSEYGIHWNFFITLAVTKIFVSLIWTTVNVKYIWINAVLLMVSHEILLEMGLKNFVLSKDKRIGFIAENKEGLVSSMGYVYLYLFSAYFSYFLELKKGCNHPRKAILKFIIVSVGTLTASIICGKYLGISRRLANSAYCFWVVFIGVFMTGLFYITSLILEIVFKRPLAPPLIYKAVNYNGLVFFLLSNVLTGLINIICDTLKLGPVSSLAILILYMFINCGTVTFLYMKKIKLKL